MAKTKPTRTRYGRRTPDGQPSVDPATKVKDAAPNFGRAFLPQIITFAGIQSTYSHVYKNPDEAIRHSVDNARFMRNDCSIMESLEGRQRSCALLNWHLEPEDKKDPRQKQLVADLTACMEEIYRFTEYRRNLLEAIWYGRTAIQNRWERRKVRGEMRFCIKHWIPVNGDKLAFRFDDGSGKFDPDQIGVRVNGVYSQHDAIAGDRRIEQTDYGMAYFLEPWERSLFTVHKHMIEDGAFEDPLSAGRIHGVGVRDRIYWCWYQKQETMAQLMEVIQRTGTGFTIYYYESGNERSKQEMLNIAQKQGPTNVILIPRVAGDESMNANGIDRIEPSSAGIDAMKAIVHEFFGHQIKRYILGQILSSESAATGLGSGVADLHQDTFMQIVQYDAVNLEETITFEVVEWLKDYNFPWAKDIRIKFKIDTKDAEAESKLQAYKSAWDMGCKLKASDVMDIIGASMPDVDDEVLQNPAMQQQQRLWEQSHPGDLGPDGGVNGQDGQPAPEGSIEDMFGPLAGELGGGGEEGRPGSPEGGGDVPGGPPGPGGPGNGMPQQYARQQVKSSPGQRNMFDPDSHRATASKWKEELHPRGDGGKFAEKGAGHVSTATEAPGGIRRKQAKSSPGQQLLGLAGDAAEQIGRALPQGPEQPFALTGKPKLGKTGFPGTGAAQQRDLFAGRGDSPGQMSFGDEIDPASKPIPDHKHPDKPLSRREAEILAGLHKTYRGLSGAELVDMAQTIAHKEAMSIDPDRGDALSAAQENRRRRDEAKRQNEEMVPKLNENLTPPPSKPVATSAPSPDDEHLARAAEVLKKIPKVTAKGLSVQLNGEVSEEHAGELLEKLRGGGSKPADLTAEDRAALPEHLKDVTPIFPSEVAKLKETGAKGQPVAPKRPREYSDQEMGLREAERTAGEVLADPNKASLRDLTIAGGHLRHQIKVERKRLERGDITKEQHDALVDSYQREIDHMDSLQRDYINGRKTAPADDMSRAEKIAEQAHIEGKSIHTVAKDQGLTHQEFSDIIEETGKHLADRKKMEQEGQEKPPSDARAKAMEAQELSGAKEVDEAAAAARKWKKNGDGTYTAPNGMVWKKAADGGEESPVTGGMFKGGRLMPIHGKSKVEIKKGTGEGETPDLSAGHGGDKDEHAKQKAAKKKGGGRKVRDRMGDLVPLPDDHIAIESLVGGSPSKTGRLDDEALAYLGVTRKQANELKEIYESDDGSPSLPRSILPEGFHNRNVDSTSWSPLKSWNEHKARQAAEAQAKDADMSRLDPDMRPPQHSPTLQSAIDQAHQQLHEAGLAEPPKAEAAADEPKAPFSLADVAAHHKALRAGEANAAQLKEWFDHYTGDDSKIREELKGKSVAELKEMGAGGWRANGMKKAELIDDLAKKIAQQYHVGESFVYQPMSETHTDALRRQIHAQTDEHVKQFVDKHKAALEERKQRVSGAVKAIENPETLEEFREREKYKSSADHPLTPEQQAKYDDLAARDRRAKDKASKSTVSAFRGGSAATGEVGIVEGHHQKRNAPTFTVTVENRLGDNWDEALSRAKRMGGNYVNAVIAKRYGATAGFQFFDRKSAEDFAKVLGGESADRSENVEQRRIESIENAAERLQALAENAHAAADEQLGKDRQTNTSRRAEAAASAEATARSQKALAETMERLSAAMKEGNAPHLEGIRHRAHVEELNSQLRRARWARMTAEGVHKRPHDEYQNFNDMPPEDGDIQHADYPYPAIWSDQLQSHLKEFKDEPGLMRIAERLGKTATEKPQFKGTVGKMKSGGGQILKPSSVESVRFANMPEGKGIRVHQSYDWRLAQAGKGSGPFYTADQGKSWGTTPEIAVNAAASRGNDIDLVDLPQPKLLKITDKSDIADLATAAKRLKRHSNRDLRRIGEELSGRIESYNRMQAMDIKSPGELRAALRDYLPLRTKPKGEDKIKRMERDLIGKKIEGFFPTPSPLVERMLDAADIGPGHSVLEPSAGKGDILDAIRERHPDAQTAGIEPHSDLRGIVEAKGHALVDRDFMQHGGKYDRIVMNPPFEKGQDAEHVRHAFDRLNPGGRIVAIMSNGPFFRSDKKSEEFRQWLESVDGSHEELPEGSFAGKDAFRQTGVNTRLVVIDKPQE